MIFAKKGIDLKTESLSVDEREFQPQRVLEEGINLSQMRSFVVPEINKVIPTNIPNQNIQEKRQENEEIFRGILEKMKKFFPLDSPFEFIEFHPTGSIGNQESFKYWQSETGRKKIVCSDLSHSSVIRFSPDDVVILKSRENFLLDEQEVNNYIQNNYQDIAVFVATGGLTSLGIVEKIAPSTYQLLKKYDIPIHADCAYGGFNIGLQRDNSQSKQEILKLMEISDSVSIDAHKFIGADNFNRFNES